MRLCRLVCNSVDWGSSPQTFFYWISVNQTYIGLTQCITCDVQKKDEQKETNKWLDKQYKWGNNKTGTKHDRCIEIIIWTNRRQIVGVRSGWRWWRQRWWWCSTSAVAFIIYKFKDDDVKRFTNWRTSKQVTTHQYTKSRYEIQNMFLKIVVDGHFAIGRR